MSSWLGVDGLSFGSPHYLWALLLVPALLAVVVLLRRRRARYAVSYTNLDVLTVASGQERRHWWWFLPLGIFVAALVMASAALARPSVQLSSADRGTTIMLVVDVSGSMAATDIVPSRLGAAVAAVRAMLVKLPKSAKVGLIGSSDQAEVLTAPTTNRTAIESALGVLTPHGGTALAEAVAEAAKILVAVVAGSGVHPSPGSELPAAIVVATDGGENRGTVGLQASAELAKADGIRIYGVTVGTPNGVISKGAGLVREQFAVPADPGTVALLARQSGGQAFSALSAASLDGIYQQLGSSVDRHDHRTDITSWFEFAAAVLLIVGAAALRYQAAALP
jgi:Ca-activated chloride channel homolog